MPKLKGQGGPGRGQGRHPVKEPRNVVKQVRWTEKEWTQVEKAAKMKGVTVSAFIREAVLVCCEMSGDRG